MNEVNHNNLLNSWYFTLAPFPSSIMKPSRLKQPEEVGILKKNPHFHNQSNQENPNLKAPKLLEINIFD